MIERNMMNEIGVVVPRAALPKLMRMLPRLQDEIQTDRNSIYLKGMAEAAHLIEILPGYDEVSWRGRRVLKIMRHNYMDVFANIDMSHKALQVPSIAGLVGPCSLEQWDWVNKNIENGLLQQLQRTLNDLFRDMNLYAKMLSELDALKDVGAALCADIVIKSHLIEWMLHKSKQEGSDTIQGLLGEIRYV